MKSEETPHEACAKSELQNLKGKLCLPDMSQVGIVVHDIDRAIEYYKDTLGLGPFVKLDIKFADVQYYGKPVDSFWKLAFCSLGPVEFELIEPVTGPSLYHDFLKEKGEGLHHIGFDVKDFDAKLELCGKLGIKVLQMGRTPVGGFAYLDTGKVGGTIFELIQRKARRA